MDPFSIAMMVASAARLQYNSQAQAAAARWRLWRPSIASLLPRTWLPGGGPPRASEFQPSRGAQERQTRSRRT